MDGHQHIQVLPEISEAIAKVMQKYSLSQIRIPFENFLGDWFEGNKAFFNKIVQDAQEAMEVYQKYAIRSTILFVKTGPYIIVRWTF